MKRTYPRLLSRWIKPFFDPKRFLEGIKQLPAYFKDYAQYNSLSLDPVNFKDSYPQLHDQTGVSTFDAHYYYSTYWAFKNVIQTNPSRHLDIASTLYFSCLLSNIIPVIFLDYRPLFVSINNLHSVGGDILNLPLKSDSQQSVSCLHVVEHIGLGRYGDHIDPLGSEKAMIELKRILAKGGNLFFCIPVGRQRVCFNGHRVFTGQNIIQKFEPLILRQYSGVDDQGQYYTNIPIDFLDQSEYGCGMFWFTK